MILVAYGGNRSVRKHLGRKRDILAVLGVRSWPGAGDGRIPHHVPRDRLPCSRVVAVRRPYRRNNRLRIVRFRVVRFVRAAGRAPVRSGDLLAERCRDERRAESVGRRIRALLNVRRLEHGDAVLVEEIEVYLVVGDLAPSGVGVILLEKLHGSAGREHHACGNLEVALRGRYRVRSLHHHDSHSRKV